MKRSFGLIALALVLGVSAANAQSIGTGKSYVSSPNAVPGEPSCAVLVVTGVIGIAVVGLRRRRSAE